MKAQKHFFSAVTGLAILFFSMTLFAEPMTTGFTYQGRLLDAGEPAIGTYDLQCKLFDAKTDGTQIGDTLVFEDGSTTDGYFTVEIDFGVEVFSGEARYLEMAFRPWDQTDPTDFVILADQVELTPTPYSLQTRGIYVDPNMLVGIGTTELTDAQLKIKTTQKHGLHVKSQVTEGPQWGIYSYVTGDTTDSSYGIRGASDSTTGDNTGVWGYARSDSPGTNIGVYGVASNTGTGDAFAGYFSLAKTYFEQNVGIGTTEPDAMLDVRGNIRVKQKIEANDSTGLELATDDGQTRLKVYDDGGVQIGTDPDNVKIHEMTMLTGDALYVGALLTLVDYPDGYSSSNSIILSVEVKVGSTWYSVGFDNLTASGKGICYKSTSTTIYVYVPDTIIFNSDLWSYRVLLMKFS